MSGLVIRFVTEYMLLVFLTMNVVLSLTLYISIEGVCMFKISGIFEVIYTMIHNVCRCFNRCE
jgi:hypothetical protein